MNAKLLWIVLSILLISCSSDSSESDTSTPNEKIGNDLVTKYPDASMIQWQYQNDYQKASFEVNGYSYNSWYNNVTGDWLVSTLSAPKDNIPQKVKDALTADLLPLSDIVSVDTLIQQNISNLFVINLGEKGIYVFTAMGYLQQRVDSRITTFPNLILMSIKAQYPQSMIMGAYKNGSTTIVDIIDNNLMKTIFFNSSNNIVWTTWYINPSNLPTTTKEILASSNYVDYYIYKSIYKVYPPSKYYEVTLMKEGSAGITLKFDKNGDLLLN